MQSRERRRSAHSENESSFWLGRRATSNYPDSYSPSSVRNRRYSRFQHGREVCCPILGPFDRDEAQVLRRGPSGSKCLPVHLDCLVSHLNSQDTVEGAGSFVRYPH